MRIGVSLKCGQGCCDVSGMEGRLEVHNLCGPRHLPNDPDVRALLRHTCTEEVIHSLAVCPIRALCALHKQSEQEVVWDADHNRPRLLRQLDGTARMPCLKHVRKHAPRILQPPPSQVFAPQLLGEDEGC
jgi:hypothetical protein